MPRGEMHDYIEMDWEARAREDSTFYIGLRENQDKGEFFEEGRRQAYRFTKEFFDSKGFDPAGKKMLDIGCGIGRMDIGFLEMFAEVLGIDVSGEMLRQAKELVESDRIRFIKGNGRDLSDFGDESFDFVFSYIAFQHIPERKIIFNYFSEIYRVLKSGGLFKIHLSRRQGGVTFALGFIPIPRLIISLIHQRGWRIHQPKSLSPEKERLMKSRSWQGIPLRESEVQKVLATLEFSEVELLEDDSHPRGTRFWCCGRKPS